MKMALDDSGGLNVVRSYQSGEVRIRDTGYRRSLIVLPDRLFPDWEPTSADALRTTHFNPLFDASIEVLILGTGVSRPWRVHDADGYRHRFRGDGQQRRLPHLQHPDRRRPPRRVGINHGNGARLTGYEGRYDAGQVSGLKWLAVPADTLQ